MCKCNNHDCIHDVYHPIGSHLQSFCTRCTSNLGSLKLCFQGHVTNPDFTLTCRICSGSNYQAPLPLPSMLLAPPMQSSASTSTFTHVRDDAHCKNVHCNSGLYGPDITSNNEGLCRDCFEGRSLLTKYNRSAGSITAPNTCGICDAPATLRHPGFCDTHWKSRWKWEDS